ncbi:hypothetical protein [Fodinicurvata sp. EGI_FJ10296]|uniref:PD-(D/E)XK nuclease family protein n=1 Tax=Fodinicurvata sp. EGI_FJ10296 TaxID=3231908 RepID=UPI00345367FF
MPPTAGAAVGTAVHAAACQVLQDRIDSGRYGQPDAALELALATFRTEVETGCEWDDTTPDRRSAEKQILRLTNAYCQHARKHVDPWLVEQHFTADVGDGFELSGHVDVITMDAGVRDLKTGALPRPYQAQVGGYSLLARSQAQPIQIQALSIDFLRRAPKTKPQDPPQIERYDLSESEAAARATVQRMKADLELFRRTGDPWSFPCNPLSMMCASDRYCPARNTGFCKFGTSHERGDNDTPSY